MEEQGRAACVCRPFQAAVEVLNPALYHFSKAGDVGAVRRLVLKPAVRASLDAAHGYLRETALHAAVQTGQTAIVRRLIAAGASVDAGNVRMETPLMRACQYGQAAVVDLLLSASTPSAKRAALAVDACGRTALHHSISHHADHPGIVRSLLASGIPVDSEDRRGDTALMLAAGRGSLPLVHVLVSAGADVLHTNQTGSSALAYTISRQRQGAAMVDQLLLLGSRAETVDTFSGATPLSLAARYQSAAVVDAILAALQPHAEAAVRARDAKGWTPLMYAAARGSASVIERLEEAGASVSGEEGSRALILASENLNPEAMTYLLERGAAALCDTEGFPSLMPACRGGDLLAVNLLLSCHGASVTASSKKGTLPLGLAAQHGHLDVVKRLIQACPAALNGKSKWGATALDVACANEHPDVVAALLSFGAPLRLSAFGAAVRNGSVKALSILLDAGVLEMADSDDRHSALRMAAEEGSLDLVDRLLAAGVPGARPGDSPLVFAAAGGHCEVVTRLLQAGVPPGEVDGEGNTGAEVAIDMGHLDVAALLYAWGG